MNGVYWNYRKKNFHGFIMPKNYVYGDMGGIMFITSGNIKNEKMRTYIFNGNGWNETALDSKHEITKAVNKRYGKRIQEKNAQYKNSFREIDDCRYPRSVTAHWQSILTA